LNKELNDLRERQHKLREEAKLRDAGVAMKAWQPVKGIPAAEIIAKKAKLTKSRGPARRF
jgi:hypothetical protein